MRILVTGTTGGIGGAVKTAAVSLGHEVFEINRADFDAAAPEAPHLPKDLDALVFCTGTCPVRPVALTSDALFAETVRVNCGLFLSLVRAVVAEKAYAASGMKIVAVSSISAQEGWPGGAAYCASKGALSALCRAMDSELGAKGISVEAMEPRYVKTRMFDSCAGRMGVSPSLARDPADLANEIMGKIGG